MSKHGKVLVAMSGGIDSSVTAILLKEQGYEVIGLTMKTWDYESSGSKNKETGCCSLDSINDARNIAVDLGFHHNILDIRSEFGDYVIDYFTDEYMLGRTPNPCVLCNTHIKWEALLKRADKLGCEYIATGHYAKVNEIDDRFYVSKGKDINKDQSYALWGISQKNLSRTMFPLGNLEKDEIRNIAIYVWLWTGLMTIQWITAINIVEDWSQDSSQRLRFFATIEQVISPLTLIVQLFFTNIIIQKLR